MKNLDSFIKESADTSVDALCDTLKEIDGGCMKVPSAEGDAYGVYIPDRVGDAFLKAVNAHPMLAAYARSLSGMRTKAFVQDMDGNGPVTRGYSGHTEDVKRGPFKGFSIEKDGRGRSTLYMRFGDAAERLTLTDHMKGVTDALETCARKAVSEDSGKPYKDAYNKMKACVDGLPKDRPITVTPHMDVWSYKVTLNKAGHLDGPYDGIWNKLRELARRADNVYDGMGSVMFGKVIFSFPDPGRENAGCMDIIKDFMELMDKMK